MKKSYKKVTPTSLSAIWKCLNFVQATTQNIEAMGINSDLQNWMQEWFERLIIRFDRIERYLEKMAVKERHKTFSSQNLSLDINPTQNASNCPFVKQSQNQSNLKWTGTQIEFVELVYALHEAGCFGKTPLKTLFASIGKMLGCEVENYYRLFWNVRNRMSEERTFFLDKLQKALSNKLFRMDSG